MARFKPERAFWFETGHGWSPRESIGNPQVPLGSPMESSWVLGAPTMARFEPEWSRNSSGSSRGSNSARNSGNLVVGVVIAVEVGVGNPGEALGNPSGLLRYPLEAQRTPHGSLGLQPWPVSRQNARVVVAGVVVAVVVPGIVVIW